MREMITMVVVLTLLSAFSGGLLAAIKNGTEARIENQVLEFVKGPAIKSILKEATNEPVKDRFKISDGETERTIFVGRLDGEYKAVAFETSGKGYGGDVGLMVAVNVDTNEIIGVEVTTHSETPGLGARAKDDPSFTAQFKGLPAENPVKVKTDGGRIDALSGATITSKAVCSAATKAGDIYNRLKPQIKEKLNQEFVK